MIVSSISDAKARLSELVHLAEAEDVTLVRYGKPAAVIMSAARFEELMDRIEDLEDNLAIYRYKADPEPTVEAGEFFASLGLKAVS